MSVYQDDVRTVEIRIDAPHLDERMESSAKPWWQDLAKSTLDFVFALVLLVLTAPIMLLAAFVVKLTSRGPIIYSQTRTGKDGMPFTIFKIRTMTNNCESQSGACWSSPGDPRITWVGGWLRRTHIDELPQLWNVLRGEMSLVGPRPERPEFVARLEQVFPDYRKRLTLKPGLSGLAQIQLPPDTDLESVRCKLVYDIYYADRRTFWIDIRIILSTVFKVLHIPAAVPQMLLRLPSGHQVEDASQVAIDGKALEDASQVFAVDKVALATYEAPSFSSVS